MNYTNNLNLKKPGYSDPADIQDINDNMDVIDQQINSFAPHVSDLVTDADGAHGLKIENGTFTPYVFGTTTTGTNTYVSQLGYYHKIGNRIYFDIYLQINTKDANMSGDVKLGGLPFVTKNDTLRRIAISIGRIDSLSYASAKQIIAWISQNTSEIILSKIIDNSNIQALQATDIDKLIINLSGNYQVN